MSEQSAVDDVLARILEPVQAAKQRLISEVVELESQIDAKRAELRKLEKVLRAADEAPRPGPKSKRVRAEHVSYPVSTRTVTAVEEWLKQDAERFRNGDGFTATQLARELKGVMSENRVRGAVDQLYERGVIVLARRGTGGSRIYRLS